MRLMYDAVTAANIPRDAEMVAGYVDQIKLPPWSAADWARFPNAVKVEIVKKASSNFGHVLDVEPGDATPAEAPGWVAMRRRAGAIPTIYVQKSSWGAVQAEFRRQGVEQPNYWIAHYNGVIELPTLNGITAVAKQYLGDVAPGIDLNCADDYWPGVDGTPSNGGGGSPGAGTSGVELMERKTIPASPSTTSVRLLLSGSPGSAIVVRPRIGVDGLAKNPVWIGNIFAWGNDKSGIGHNPKTDGTKDFRLESHRRIELPGAVWADLEYSSTDSFEIDIVG